jgi:PAS domain S-box-containing protein
MIGDGLPTVIANHKGRIEWVNNSFTRLSGYDSQDLKGARVEILMPQSYKADHVVYFKEFARTKGRELVGMGRELPLVCKDGTVKKLIIRLSLINTLFTGRKIAAIFIEKT